MRRILPDEYYGWEARATHQTKTCSTPVISDESRSHLNLVYKAVEYGIYVYVRAVLRRFDMCRGIMSRIFYDINEDYLTSKQRGLQVNPNLSLGL
jgi:hypothetical protein